MSSGRGGRPPGTLNKPGHAAGGARVGAGRKSKGQEDLSARAGSSDQNPTLHSTGHLGRHVQGIGPQNAVYKMFRKRLEPEDSPSPSSSSTRSVHPDKRPHSPDPPDSDEILARNRVLLSQSQSNNNHGTAPNIADDVDLDSDDEPDFAADDDPVDSLSDTLLKSQSEHDTPICGVVQTYLVGLKDQIRREIDMHGKPVCYTRGTFWIHPQDPFFAMAKSAKSADGLSPHSLYYPSVFVWLPHLLDVSPLHCTNAVCQSKHCTLTVKGWNDNPVARRVVTLDGVYYVMTMRMQCGVHSGGCGKSWNLYDPIILEQLDPGLAAAFPAFLTHRSGIDKTIMTLVRAGMAHRVSSSAWSKIFRELDVRKHALFELDYLNAIHTVEKQAEALQLAERPAYEPFSAFGNKLGYAVFPPSRWYLNTVYMDYMEHIRPILDQYVASLTGYIIKWDLSFKLPKLLMKLEGSETFSALFTLLNELEQIRYQAFVPTKSLAHIRDGLMAMVKSLEERGLAQPIMGFSDNPRSDARTFMECIPALKKNVKPIQAEEVSDSTPLELPTDVTVHTCYSEQEIQTACGSILEQLPDNDHDAVVRLGFDMEWEFSTGPSATGPRKTALVQMALMNTVYLFHVYTLKKLPGMLCTLLASEKFIKIGRNVTGDLAKLSRDFPEFVWPSKQKGTDPKGIIELGRLAKAKNAVTTAKASLSAIAVATLHHYIPKDVRTSSWSTSPLSEEQVQYAALDAWSPLKIAEVLQQEPTVGQTLKVAAPVGQLVSVYVGKQEVARGTIVSQPQKFLVGNDNTGNAVYKNISSTKTRAVIRVDEVLARSCILALHNKSLAELQGDMLSFEVVVNLSMPRTRSASSPVSVSASTGPPREVDDNITVPQPPNFTGQDEQISSESSDEEEGGDEGNNEQSHIHSDKPAEVMQIAEQDYIQNIQSGSYPTSVIGDVFHVEFSMQKLLKQRHSLKKPFGHALSATLLVPDRGDQRRVEVVLKKKNISWDYAVLSRPEWLWKRVRRYIPKKNLLYSLLKELFECWGPIVCSTSKIPLFDDEAWKKANDILLFVQEGWLADLDGIPMYVEEGTDRNGLTLYRSLRGTNSVEGAIHNPIRRSFGALNASPELGDCLVADFRHRHNTDMGVKHKLGIEYRGHYDPWLDHEISSKRADIHWKSKPPAIPSSYDSDPLSFAQTEEQFGIAGIPVALRTVCDFGGPEVISPSQNSALVVSHIYPTKLHLSRLKGTRADMYTYLAAAQKTKFAVTPCHTAEEFALFNKAVSPGGPWFVSQRQPNFDRMAAWWSSKANGKNIFYKLPEYLSSYHKKWLARRQTKESLIASDAQRRPHQSRIRSVKHSAQVLPAASRTRPGIVPDVDYEEPNNGNPANTQTLSEGQSFSPGPNEHEASEPMTVDDHNIDISQADIQWPSSPIATAPIVMFHPNADVPIVTSVQTPVVNTSARPSTTLPGPSVPIMISSSQMATSMFTWNSHKPDEMVQTTRQPRRHRRCQVCVNAGREGSDCPGGNNRDRCKYNLQE